jgi:hypothetical protein
MTIPFFRDTTLCHIPEDLNLELHCCQNIKTHFLKNLTLRQNSSSPSSAVEDSSLLGSDAVPLSEYFVTSICLQICTLPSSSLLPVHLPA